MGKIKSYSKIIIIALALLSLLLAPIQAGAVNFIVSQANTNGWGFLLDSGTTPAGSFVTGPAAPPAGTGSVRIVTPAINDGMLFGVQNYLGTQLADITSLTYSTYRTSGTAALAISFQINIDYDTTDVDPGWQGRLVYEPYLSGTSPSTGTWETWDALDPNARWWGSDPTYAAPCLMASPCSWADLLANFPNAAVHPNPLLGGIGFKAGSTGSSWIGFDGNVDNLTFGVSGTDDNYDFENIAPVNVYVDDDWTGTVVGEDPDGAGPATVYGGDAFDTIQGGVTAVATFGMVNVFEGTYPENVTVNKSLTIDGSGNGTNPLFDTVMDGSTLGATTSGIQLLANVTNVTIQDLTIQNYALSSTNYGGIAGAGNNNFFTAQNLRVSSNTGGRGGIYLNGPVDTVLIDNIIAHSNANRGIVIWNGFKTNITITNNNVQGTNCCGIELQDGTASGVTMSGNTVVSNGDSGMSALGLTSGAGPNVISNNTITDNGRFGLEIKNPNGTGLDSGDGSIVVENNTVTFVGPTADDRDHAGIAVFRRDVGGTNVDIPTGVIVRNNNVSGYLQTSGTSDSEGFGIIVEGTNMQVLNNTVGSNDVGLQVQAGHLPYPGNGDQSDLLDTYFGRGNSPIGCAEFAGNIDGGGNGTLFRSVGTTGSGTVNNLDTGESFCSIQTAIDDTDTLDGHTLDVGPGTYAEDIFVNKDLTIQGDSPGTTFANPASDTGTSGDARAWWLVDDGVEFHLSNMTFDGSGFLVFTGIRQKGFGSIDNVVFTEIKYNESGPNYAGVAVTARGTGPVDITNSTFTEIGRLGVLYYDVGQSNSLFDNNSYTGKGVGDWLDYALDISGGAVVNVSNNTISANRGVASSDGSTSACILITTYFGAGTQATITNNDLSNCSTAVFEGYDAADTSDMVVKGNTIDNVDFVFQQTGTAATMNAYANNVSNFGDAGLTTAAGTFEARRNWWDSHFVQPTGVDTDSWDHRLGAAVQTWSEGSGTATLTDIGNSGTTQLSGGSGTAVIISHGRPTTVAEAPFGNGVSGYYNMMCSDFYDMFLLTGATGSWTASVPIDGNVGCTPTLTNEVIFWIPWGTDYSTECAPASNGFCWDLIDPIDVMINGSNLEVQNLTFTELSGTPFVAGNNTQTDPTAITLSILDIRQSQTALILFVVVLLMAGLSWFVFANSRKQANKPK